MYQRKIHVYVLKRDKVRPQKEGKKTAIKNFEQLIVHKHFFTTEGTPFLTLFVITLLDKSVSRITMIEVEDYREQEECVRVIYNELAPK